MAFRIVVFKGKTIEPYLRVLSQMRVSEFYNFPYLYYGEKYHFQEQGFNFLTPYNTRQSDGSVKEEENRLKCWIRTYDSLLKSV